MSSGTLAGQARFAHGAGAVLNVDRGDKDMLQEIADCQIDVERLFIDPQAMIISDADVEATLEFKKTIGSTGQGWGCGNGVANQSHSGCRPRRECGR
jgi:adenylosuccinate synthase